jgi:hypothetical protein
MPNNLLVFYEIKHAIEDLIIKTINVKNGGNDKRVS